MSLLDEIFNHKRTGLEAVKAGMPARELEAQIRAAHRPPDFISALRDPGRPAPRLIAEIKRRSPSRGVLSANLDPADLARVYAENGASAISVLTDERYFDGSLDDLRTVSALGTGLPRLRKDFIFDRYQLLEARAAGASAVLLIVAMLGAPELPALVAEAREMDLAALVEVHSESELERALDSGAEVIGINNRDLHHFTVDLATCERLRPMIPAGIVVVAESGIHTFEDVQRISSLEIDAILVGEALVKARDIAAKTSELSRLAPAGPKHGRLAQDGD